MKTALVCVLLLGLAGCGDNKTSTTTTGNGSESATPGMPGMPGMMPGTPGMPGTIPNMPDGMKFPTNAEEAKAFQKKLLQSVNDVELTDAKMESFFAFYEEMKADPAKALSIAKKYKDWSTMAIPKMAAKFALVKAVMDDPSRRESMGVTISDSDIAVMKKWLPKWQALLKSK